MDDIIFVVLIGVSILLLSSFIFIAVLAVSRVFVNNDELHTQKITKNNYSHYTRDLIFRSIFKAFHGWPDPTNSPLVSATPVVVKLPEYAFRNKWADILDILSENKQIRFERGNPIAWSNVTYVLFTQMDFSEYSEITFSLYNFIPRSVRVHDELINVYVTRGKNKLRHISNEGRLLANISSSCLVVDLSERQHTARSQALMFSKSKSLISVHGAALANMIYMPPSTTVIEIMPLKYGKKTYKNLAKLCGLSYERIDGGTDNVGERDAGGLVLTDKDISKITAFL